MATSAQSWTPPDASPGLCWFSRTSVIDGKAEQELEISEVRYRRLFESAHDGILILDAVSTKVLDVNPYMADLLG